MGGCCRAVLRFSVRGPGWCEERGLQKGGGCRRAGVAGRGRCGGREFREGRRVGALRESGTAKDGRCGRTGLRRSGVAGRGGCRKSGAPGRQESRGAAEGRRLQKVGCYGRAGTAEGRGVSRVMPRPFPDCTSKPSAPDKMQPGFGFFATFRIFDSVEDASSRQNTDQPASCPRLMRVFGGADDIPPGRNRTSSLSPPAAFGCGQAGNTL